MKRSTQRLTRRVKDKIRPETLQGQLIPELIYNLHAQVFNAVFGRVCHPVYDDLKWGGELE